MKGAKLWPNKQMQQLQPQVVQIQLDLNALTQQGQQLSQSGQSDQELTSCLQKLNQLSQAVNQLQQVINNYSSQLNEFIVVQDLTSRSPEEIVKDETEVAQHYGLSDGQAGALLFQPHLDCEAFDKEAKRMADENRSSNVAASKPIAPKP